MSILVISVGTKSLFNQSIDFFQLEIQKKGKTLANVLKLLSVHSKRDLKADHSFKIRITKLWHL